MFTEPENKSSILIIDPDPSLRALLDLLLNGDSQASLSDNSDYFSYLIHDCQTCADATMKIQASLQNNLPYHLIFVESQLADGDGLQLINQLWQIDNRLHVVLCSADQTLTWQKISATVGESDQLLILQKPFCELELRQIVHAMIRKWQLSMQSQQVMEFMKQQIMQSTQEMEETHKRLLQADKLAAVGQLAAGIAHEINTPAQYVGDNIRTIGEFFTSMTHLLDYCRDLLQQTGQTELLNQLHEHEEQEDLEFILEDAPLALKQSLEGMDQIVRIVQAMKGFAHIDQSQSAEININLLLENTLLITHNSYKYLADLETCFGELPTIECFPGELNQVFLNIIINAAHAIEESHKGRGKITIQTTTTQDGVEIRISDTGNGIPEAIRNRIFDPFFTTKEVGKGTGQGLNIAYRIINQQHFGNINFTSEIGVGTTFIINLHRRLQAH